MALRKLVLSGSRGLFLLILFVVSSAIVVSLYNYYQYSQGLMNFEVRRLDRLFDGDYNFSEVAKKLLNTRGDIAFVKLIDESGTLQESYGNNRTGAFEEVTVKAPGDKLVKIGLSRTIDREQQIYTTLWSILIGIVFGSIFLMIFIKFSSDRSVHLERLISAMKKVSFDDFSSGLDIDRTLKDDVIMIRLFDSYNQMINRLKRHGKEVIEEEPEPFKPRVVISAEDTKDRRVTAFVAKISNFDSLSNNLDTVEFSNFLTEYRKTASSIISDYNGTIEALLQGEIVALFNVPDEQDNPELRAVSAAVEVIQILANLNRQKRLDGKEIIGGMVGLAMKKFQLHTESGVPQDVKQVISEARATCDNAGLWKIVVSGEMYENIRDHVEAKKIEGERGLFYSIISVEEGIIKI